jgi:hypothetical protein
MTIWERLVDKFFAPKVVRPRYTEEELMVRLKFFIGICLALTLIGIVFVVLYSIIFVTQPLNAISPIDSKFFELIIPVATFLCGTLSGIMLAGSGQDAMRSGAAMAKRPTEVSPTPTTSAAPVEPPKVTPPVSAPPRVSVPVMPPKD